VPALQAGQPGHQAGKPAGGLSSVGLMSMTGYGRALCRAGGLSAQAEARSVNGRYLQVRLRLPGDLARLEPRVEALVKQSLARGTVDVSVRIEADRQRGLPRIDTQVLARYRKALSTLGGGEPALLLSLPGVIGWDEDAPREAALDKLAITAATQAIARLTTARAAEGKRLAVALRRELVSLRKLIAAVRRRLPASVALQQANLRRRVEVLLASANGVGRSSDAGSSNSNSNGSGASRGGSLLSPTDPSLQRELALLADRSDISEELDRLDSHFTALDALLGRAQPAGRELDFLLQEVSREVNTLGAKAGDAQIVSHVIQAKTAVERLREQAANIE
jgi:uncharacterized protein YicC (UPF0701 family)